MKTKLVILIPSMLVIPYSCWGQNNKSLEIHFIPPPPTAAVNVKDCMMANDPKFYHEIPDSISPLLRPDLANTYHLTDQEIQVFTLKEKIAFAIYHPESYTQICSFYSEETDYQKFLHAYLRGSNNIKVRSRRQNQILEDNRDSTITYLASCLHTTNYIGEHEKKIIVRLKGYECIPALLDIYAKKSDTDILTMCINLMENDDFSPLYESRVHKELYGVATDSDISYRDNHSRKIPLTQENAAAIITLAHQYYTWKLQHK